MVRAKFKVNEIVKRLHWDKSKGPLFVIKLSPVTSGSKENEQFYDTTPAGSIELGTLNAAAGEQLDLGAEYYVDFTRAEPAQAKE